MYAAICGHRLLVKYKRPILLWYRYWKIETTKHRQGGNAYLWLAVLKCMWWPLFIQGIILGVMVSVVYLIRVTINLILTLCVFVLLGCYSNNLFVIA